jgi:hypothetical protein
MKQFERNFLFLLIVFLGTFMHAYGQLQDIEKEQYREFVELDQLGIINRPNEIIGGDQRNQQVFTPSQGSSLFPSGLPSQGNYAGILQYGNNNTGSIIQSGQQNSFGLLQEGNNNQYEGLLSGESNFIRVFQLGNNNRVSQDLWGTNMNLEVIQEGNYHHLIQVERDGTSPSYQVHMQGNNGMEVIINHEVILNQ